MDLEEIEAVYNSFKTCPRCGSSEGFWMRAKPDAGYVQCKHCGEIFELCEVVPVREEKGKRAASKISILRRKIRF
jgi:transcription elongation factor Elf1